MSRRTLHQYKLRLTNLSQSNRSLKLNRLSAYKDLDWTIAAEANKMTAGEMLARIVAGKSVDLVSKLSARDEKVNLLDRRLTKIYREAETLYEETGSDDLFLGYPFVEGKFLNGTVARCPILLFPVRLVRDLSGKIRWKLEVPKGESIQFNRTFFLAYEKYQKIRLPKSFWEEEVSHQPDLQSLLNLLYDFFRNYDLSLNFNSDLFRFEVTHFPDKRKGLLESLGVGKLKFYPHAVLGIFPQSDSALVRDYDLLENEGEKFEVDQYLNFAQEKPPIKYIPENQRYFVTQVDQSQEEALLAVKSGQSVVLHGPPGTGKSQVILNLIGDSLAQGKRVLVCSQKRAALDVVYHRLSELGLGPYAALVHDYRGDRKKIFEKIRIQLDALEEYKRDTIDLNQSKWERDFRLSARQIDDFNGLFDEISKALNDSSRFGISAHQLYLLADAGVKPYPIKGIAKKFDYSSLYRALEKFKGTIDYAEFFDTSHPWRDRVPFSRYGLEDKARLMQKAELLKEELSEIARFRGDTGLLKSLSLNTTSLRNTLLTRRSFLGRLTPEIQHDVGSILYNQLNKSTLSRKLGSLQKIFAAMQEFQILDDFNRVNLFDLKKHVDNYFQYQGKFGRMLNLEYLRARWYLRTILKNKSRKYTEENFKQLKREFKVLERLMEHNESFGGILFFDDLPLTDTIERLQAWHARKSASFQWWVEMKGQKEWKRVLPRLQTSSPELDPEHLALCHETLDKTEAYLDLVDRMRLRWREWLHPGQIEAVLSGAKPSSPDPTQANKLKTALDADFEELRSLDRFLDTFEPRERELLERLQTEIRHGDAFLNTLKNSIFQFWIEALEEEHPPLLEVSSRMMTRNREAYRDRVQDRQEKVIQLILRKLKAEIIGTIEYNRLGNPVTYRKLGHQVRKKRLLWSVRRLIRECWEESLSRLMPCWLASPESVSAIFPMEKDFFDLVIFDEASQCYVERALPVMLRGKACVIAGDDKQLPPFDLYNVKIEEDEEEIDEVGMALEVESALDLARGIFTEVHLSWHYRSVEEELINFSNYAFYGGRLNVIPPARISEEPPIEFKRVSGVWDRNRNMDEAKAVIETVEKLIQHPDSPTMGIVTFNFQQKELIRDLLEQRMRELIWSGNYDLLKLYRQALFREEKEERQGLFIKNIENVQGDERDVIIFSIAYARNYAGKLTSNFGLLNQKGGENRLNVAITRARQKVIVICSFNPVEMDVENALNPGPRLFKQYLLYASAVHQGDPDMITQILKRIGGSNPAPTSAPLQDQEGNELADQVARDLESRGYQILRGIGDTNYKLDLAVYDEQKGYLLGIECEGRHYFAGKSSKEREVYRYRLLERRGWKLYRVWARNYYLDREKELDKMEGLIQELNK